MANYYGYTRVSTETQVEKGYGLDTQREAIEKYAKEKGITVAEYFEDAGISGNIHDDADDDAINKRQGLIQLLSVLNDGDTVIVLNTSRLWRSDMAKVIVRRELMKHNAKLISIEQPRYDLYSKDPSEYLINAIIEALDVYERMNIAIKLSKGRTTKAMGGNKPCGICPFGYQYTADKKSVEVVEADAAIVKRMFTEAQKGHSLQEIADIINGLNVAAPRGGEWTKGSVQAILRNRFYIGVLMHQGQEITGSHEPIISKIQFGKVAAQLDRRHK